MIILYCKKHPFRSSRSFPKDGCKQCMLSHWLAHLVTQAKEEKNKLDNVKLIRKDILEIHRIIRAARKRQERHL